MLRYLKLSIIDLLLGYLIISTGATLRSFLVDSRNIVDSLSSFLYIIYLPLLLSSFATLLIFAFLNGLFFIKKIKSKIFLILFFQLVIMTIIAFVVLSSKDSFVAYFHVIANLIVFILLKGYIIYSNKWGVNG